MSEPGASPLTDGTPAAGSKPRRSLRTGWALALVAAALPPLTVDFPPASDLPQHLAQVRLWLDLESGRLDEGLHEVAWLAPNTLVYSLLRACWAIFGPERTGPIAIALLCMGWVSGTFALAGRRDRPLPAALFASVFVFNLSLYWGFLNFLVGYPIFVAWWLLAKARQGALQWVGLLVASAFLYWSHSLWFAFASLAMPILVLPHRSRWRRVESWAGYLATLSSMLPIGLYATLGTREMASARASFGFDVAAHWANMPWERVAPTYLLPRGLEGAGPLPEALVLLAIIWLGAGALRMRSSEHRGVAASSDWALLGTACVALAIFLLAPNKYMNTIHFNSRFLPVALVFGLLALPMPKLDARLLRMGTAALLLIFSLHTAATWMQIEREELSGLSEALAELPHGERVLGLDFVKQSELIGGRPFLQTSSYADAWRGATTHFSFAEHGNGVVRFKSPPRREWTSQLEWFPERVRESDFFAFDFVLVNLRDPDHARFGEHAPVEPLTNQGRWRLYRVKHPPWDSAALTR